jgi:ammonium transporter, Amt family
LARPSRTGGWGARRCIPSPYERIKPLALYIIAFFLGALGERTVGYLCWGSTSPLTNSGFHGYVGVTSRYLLVGVTSLMINLRVRPRLSRFQTHRAKLPRPWGTSAR